MRAFHAPGLLIVGTLLAACWHGAAVRDDKPRVSPLGIETAAPPPASATFSTDHVLGRISSTYAPQVRRCYQGFLKKHGDTQGKIFLSFTIDRTGHLVNARADGMARQITSCVERKMSTWYFTRPPTAGDEARFRVPIQLVSI